MPKMKLLLLDANVIIELFRIGLWDVLLDRCEIVLARTVADVEVRYYHGRQYDEIIDLSPYAGRIRIVDVEASALAAFRALFQIPYLERLDPGETESLAYLHNAEERHFICSSDAIVHKVMACLNREDQAVSLEWVLATVGRGRKVEKQFSEAFRQRWVNEGKQDSVRGRALL